MSDMIVSKGQAVDLQFYASNLGVSVEECLSEAVADWLNNVGPARFRDFSHFEKAAVVIPFHARKAG